MLRVYLWFSSNRIETQEYVLLDVRLAFHKLDAPAILDGPAIEKPQISIARDIDQTLDGAPITLVIHQDRRRNLVPIPRVVRIVLEMTLDRAG